MFDYELLRVIWWGLMGILLMGFAIFDGFDLGVAGLLPFVAREDVDRRVLINTVGPVWEGNQVWLILAGGVLFAAFPYLYAVSFSGLYLAILLVLATLILRPVAFKYRSKLASSRWRSFWDWSLSIAGILGAVTFGVAVGNALLGVPFYFDASLRVFYTGTFWALFHPFALLCGVLSLCLLWMQGASYLTVKVRGPLQTRASTAVRWLAVLVMILFAIAGFWVAHLNGYVVTSLIDPRAPSNPLHKQASAAVGAWLLNYHRYALAWVVPFLGFLGAALAWLFSWGRWRVLTLCSSSLSVMGVVGTVGVSTFPFLLPSSSHPAMSLLVWDSSASQLSLMTMLGVVVVFFPIVLLYTAWVYRVLRGPVTARFVLENEDSTY